MSTLDQYRQAKGSITQLEAAAKKELTVKFHALTTEMFAVQKELREEFGVRLAIPKKPPAKARQLRTKVATVVAAATVVESSPKIRALERKIETQRKKVATASDPKVSTAARDRIYELEDELRLERESVTK